MNSEAAIRLPELGEDVGGGFWTPASALGLPLIERLREHAGLMFEMVD